MAETQDSSLGYGGEFHLHNGSVLYELVEVKEFDIPTPGAREQVEKTHLKSEGWRREYHSSFYEDSEFEVVGNTRLLSDTDTLLDDARNDGDVRAFKAVVPENGEPTSQIEGTAVCIDYDRGRVVSDGVIEFTARFRVVSIDDAEAYAS